MLATVLVEWAGWTGLIQWSSDNVRRLCPEHRPIDPAADWLTCAAGDASQCNLRFPSSKIELKDGTTTLLPMLVITAAHSRFVAGQMIPRGDLVPHVW